MEMWGSSYLLQDVTPVRLVATLGGSTSSETMTGFVVASFSLEPGVLTMTRSGPTCEIALKWDVALRLMALLHVVVLQNKILRGEAPELRIVTNRSRPFTVEGGMRSSPLVCSWSGSSNDVQCKAVEGQVDQFELFLTENAAVELILALAERFALSGTATARTEPGLK